MGSGKRIWELVKELDAIRSLAFLLAPLTVGGVSAMLSILDVPAWGIALGATIAGSVLLFIVSNMLFNHFARQAEVRNRQAEARRIRAGQGLLEIIDSLYKDKVDKLLFESRFKALEDRLAGTPESYPFTEWLRRKRDEEST